MSNLYIQAKPSEEWVRPGGWLTMPTITSGDTRIAMLVAVYDKKNIFTFKVDAGTSFEVNVDWGDGSSSTINNTSAVVHTYDYAAIGGIILKDEFGDSYKQVIVDVTLNSGTVTRFELAYSVAIRKNNIVDMIASWPNCVFSFSYSVPTLQRLLLLNYNYDGQLMASYNFKGLIGLRKLQFDLPIAPSSITSAFQSLGPVDFGDLTVTNAPIGMSNLFGSISTFSLVKSVGTIDLSLVTSAVNNMFQNCTNLKRTGEILVPLSTNINTLFGGCVSLINPGRIHSDSTTTIGGIFSGCLNLKSAEFTSLAAVTASTSSAFANCESLQYLRVPGLKVTTTLANTNLDRQALVQVFNDLGTAATTQTITVTRTPGSADLTAGDIAIATGKNWTVVL